MQYSGFIRFVGGPWHNRHVPVDWRDYIQVINERPRKILSYFKLVHSPVQDVLTTSCYKLREFGWGHCRWFEYIHETVTDAEYHGQEPEFYRFLQFSEAFMLDQLCDAMFRAQS